MNRHFRSQVRLSCDGKLTRNRANSNFHPQPAIVILAPICSSQFVFELVSRDCQPHSHFSCLSLFLHHSTSLFYSTISLHPAHFICCRPLRTSPRCLALLESIRGSGMSPFSSALFFSCPSPFLPSQPRDVCWFVHVLSLTHSPPLRSSQPKSGDWRLSRRGCRAEIDTVGAQVIALTWQFAGGHGLL